MRIIIENELLELQYIPGNGAWTYQLIIPNSKNIKGKWGDLKVSGTIDGYAIQHKNLGPVKNGDKKISKKTIQNYKKILEFMEEGKEYTIQDFCNLLNLKPSRTKELLKALTQDIEQIGNNKNRKYRLK